MATPSPYIVSRDDTRWRQIRLIVAGVVLAVASGAAGIYLGKRHGETSVRVEAVKTGHARYTITDEYGNTRFEWAPACLKPQAQPQETPAR